MFIDSVLESGGQAFVLIVSVLGAALKALLYVDWRKSCRCKE